VTGTTCGHHAKVSPEWARHQVLNAVDYCVLSPLWNTLSIGLNAQVIHHLFPQIDDCHYADLYPIVQQTCREFDVPYEVKSSFFEAVTEHFKHLTVMNESCEEVISAKMEKVHSILQHGKPLFVAGAWLSLLFTGYVKVLRMVAMEVVAETLGFSVDPLESSEAVLVGVATTNTSSVTELQEVAESSWSVSSCIPFVAFLAFTAAQTYVVHAKAFSVDAATKKKCPEAITKSQ